VNLDGGSLPGQWTSGLQIVSSNANTFGGLQISNISGRAVVGLAAYRTMTGH
jgi:hypothetical protein